MLTIDGVMVPDNATSSIDTCLQRFDAKSFSFSVTHHQEQESDFTYHASNSGS